MPFVYATALPALAGPTAEARLRTLCARWEHEAGPRLSPGELAHCRRFSPRGDALRARASRLLARLLALRALPPDTFLDRDESGRPRVGGGAGWHIAFSHSGRAAFCLVCGPGETMTGARALPALDAEAWGAPAPGDRAFQAPAPGRGSSLRRWVLAEALFKALGATPDRWDAVAAVAHAHAGERAGAWPAEGARLSWQILAAPGHIFCMCMALPEGAPPTRLRWLPWHSLF